jgi:hypothetical protein
VTPQFRPQFRAAIVFDLDGTFRLDDVMSVGDHFVNDIRPAVELGCATAYMDPYGIGPKHVAAFHAATVEEVLDPLRLWVKEKEEA